MSGCGAEHGLISIDEALDLVINKPKNLSSIQKTLKNSLSSYLAKEIYSEINLPSFSQSAVDGYALCSHTEDLNNQKFQVTGEIRAGSESHDILGEGQAIRIFTGGKIPEGTTHVARQEIVSVFRLKKFVKRNISALKPISALPEKKSSKGSYLLK
ncbi:moeA domain protein [Acinetobacter baumannii 44362_4]|nr:moeA domain protein [Acinetobacter baumannii 44362_4]